MPPLLPTLLLLILASRSAGLVSRSLDLEPPLAAADDDAAASRAAVDVPKSEESIGNTACEKAKVLLELAPASLVCAA